MQLSSWGVNSPSVGDSPDGLCWCTGFSRASHPRRSPKESNRTAQRRQPVRLLRSRLSLTMNPGFLRHPGLFKFTPFGVKAGQSVNDYVCWTRGGGLCAIRARARKARAPAPTPGSSTPSCKRPNTRAPCSPIGRFRCFRLGNRYIYLPGSTCEGGLSRVSGYFPGPGNHLQCISSATG